MRVAWALTLVLAACAGDVDRVDGTADGPPARIVSMAPSLTEILFALDLGDRVVGVTEYCDYPPEAGSCAKIGGFVNPSVEAILALEPDLVVVSPAAGNREAALAVRRAGVRLEVVPAETLDDTWQAIAGIAAMCGVPERGDRLIEAIRSRIDHVQKAVAGRTAVAVLYSVQVDPLIAAGPGTLPSELVELAGGVNVVETERYPRIGIESVLDRAPEVILQARMDRADGGDEALRDFWMQWSSIPAVESKRVFVFDGTTSLRAGPRVADAVDFLARSLHPELDGKDRP